MGKKNGKNDMFEGGIPRDILMDPVALDAYLSGMNAGSSSNEKMETSSIARPKSPVSDGDYRRNKSQSTKPSMASTIDRAVNSRPAHIVHSATITSETVEPDPKDSAPVAENKEREVKFCPYNHTIWARIFDKERTAYGPYLALTRTGARTTLSYPAVAASEEYLKDKNYEEDDLDRLVYSFYVLNKIMFEPDAVCSADHIPERLEEALNFADNDQVIGILSKNNLVQFYVIDNDYVYDRFIPEATAILHQHNCDVVATIFMALSTVNMTISPVSVAGAESENAFVMMNNFINIVNEHFQDPTVTDSQDINEFIHEQISFIEFQVGEIGTAIGFAIDKYSESDDDEDDDQEDNEFAEETPQEFEPFTNDNETSEIGGVQDDNEPFRSQPSTSGNTGEINRNIGSSSNEKVDEGSLNDDSKRGYKPASFGTPLSEAIAKAGYYEAGAEPNVPSGDRVTSESGVEKEKEDEKIQVEGNGSGNADLIKKEGEREEPNKEKMVIPVTIVGR